MKQNMDLFTWAHRTGKITGERCVPRNFVLFETL